MIEFITIPWNSDFITFGQIVDLTVELDNPINIGPRRVTISLGFFMVVSPGTPRFIFDTHLSVLFMVPRKLIPIRVGICSTR